MYGWDLRELPLETSLSAAIGASSLVGAVPPAAATTVLHLLPYKRLWEEYWANQKGAGGGAAMADSGASAAEPDWLPLYWHLWMSDERHCASMPCRPPEGCPPVSFLHDADTPLSVSLAVFADWMGLRSPPSDVACPPGLEGGGVASPHAPVTITGPSEGAEQPEQPDRKEEERLGKASGAKQSEQSGQSPPQRAQQPERRPAATVAPDTRSAVAAAPSAGCGSWSRQIEWLRGGGARVLRMLAAAAATTATTATTAASVSSSGSGGSGSRSASSSDGGCGSAGCCVSVAGGSSCSGAEAGPGGSNRQSNGSSAGCPPACEAHGPDGSPRAGEAWSRSYASSAGGAGSGTASVQCASEDGDAACPSHQHHHHHHHQHHHHQRHSHTGSASPLRLLWLNRSVCADACPAHLGMCDQSVVALLNLCGRPDCAPCLMTHGSLTGDCAAIERAVAAGGLGPLDEQQCAPPLAGVAAAAGECGDGEGEGCAQGPGRPPMLMPLGIAAANGHEAALQLLLDCRVDNPNVVDKFGLPALWFAVEHAQPGAVAALLAAGARAADWVFAAGPGGLGAGASARSGNGGSGVGPAAAVTRARAASFFRAEAGGGRIGGQDRGMDAAAAAADEAARLPPAVASYPSLCHAVEVGDVRTVRAMLAAGACPYTPDDSNGTPYHMAIERGDVGMVQALLDGDPAFEDLQAAQCDAYRRLAHASQRVERSEVAGCPCVQCNYRVAIRAPPNPDTDALRSALQLVGLPAVMDGAPPAAVVPLLAAMRARGASLDAHDAEGYTALHLAVRAGHLEALRWLLQQGASPAERDALGYQPLHMLAHYGCSAAPATPGTPGAKLAAAGDASPPADATAAAADGSNPSSCSLSGGQLELAAARVLVEEARVALGAKTSCFAYEADVRTEEAKLRSAGPASAAQRGRRGGPGSSSSGGTSGAAKRRDPMLTVPLYGGHTAAQLALRYGRPLLLAYLLHRGSPLDLSAPTWRHCLEKALEAGHSAAARILLSYAQQGRPAAPPPALLLPAAAADADTGSSDRSPEGRRSGGGGSGSGTSRGPKRASKPEASSRSSAAAAAPRAAATRTGPSVPGTTAAATEVQDEGQAAARGTAGARHGSSGAEATVAPAPATCTPPHRRSADGGGGIGPSALIGLTVGLYDSAAAAAGGGAAATAEVTVSGAAVGALACDRALANVAALLLLERRRAQRTAAAAAVAEAGAATAGAGATATGGTTHAAAGTAPGGVTQGPVHGSPAAAAGADAGPSAAGHESAGAGAAADEEEAAAAALADAAESSKSSRSARRRAARREARRTALPAAETPAVAAEAAATVGEGAAQQDPAPASAACTLTPATAPEVLSGQCAALGLGHLTTGGADLHALAPEGHEEHTGVEAGPAGAVESRDAADVALSATGSGDGIGGCRDREVMATGSPCTDASNVGGVGAVGLGSLEGEGGEWRVVMAGRHRRGAQHAPDSPASPPAPAPLPAGTRPEGVMGQLSPKAPKPPQAAPGGTPTSTPGVAAAPSQGSGPLYVLVGAGGRPRRLSCGSGAVTPPRGQPPAAPQNPKQQHPEHEVQQHDPHVLSQLEAARRALQDPTSTTALKAPSMDDGGGTGAHSPPSEVQAGSFPPAGGVLAAGDAAPPVAAPVPPPPPGFGPLPSAAAPTAAPPPPSAPPRRQRSGSEGYIEVPRSLLYGKRSAAASPTPPPVPALAATPTGSAQPPVTAASGPRAATPTRNGGAAMAGVAMPSLPSLPPAAAPTMPVAVALSAPTAAKQPGTWPLPGVPSAASALPRAPAPGPGATSAVAAKGAGSGASGAAGSAHLPAHPPLHPGSFAAAVRGEGAGHAHGPGPGPASAAAAAHPLPVPHPPAPAAGSAPRAWASTAAATPLGKQPPASHPSHPHPNPTPQQPQNVKQPSPSRPPAVPASPDAAQATCPAGRGAGTPSAAAPAAAHGRASPSPARAAAGRGGAPKGHASVALQPGTPEATASAVAATHPISRTPCPMAASRLNPKAHEFVPTHAPTPGSAAKPAANGTTAAVHLAVPTMHAATPGPRGAPPHSPNGHGHGGARDPHATPPAAATAAGLLSPWGPHPGAGSGAHGATPPASARLEPRSLYSFYPAHQQQQPPASPVAQVMSWQAVQPIQVLSSPIRRLPDESALYRAMVSAYCPFSPRPSPGVSGVAATQAGTAAAAAAAAVVGFEGGDSNISGGGRVPTPPLPPYNPLAAPLPALSLQPYGLFCGEQLIRPSAARQWDMDPLQQLRATQTALEATIAAAFNVPTYLTATAGCVQGDGTGDADSSGGSGSAGGMPALRLSMFGGGGGWAAGGRVSSGGGAGEDPGSGARIVRSLHSIFAEEELREQAARRGAEAEAEPRGQGGQGPYGYGGGGDGSGQAAGEQAHPGQLSTGATSGAASDAVGAGGGGAQGGWLSPQDWPQLSPVRGARPVHPYQQQESGQAQAQGQSFRQSVWRGGAAGAGGGGGVSPLLSMDPGRLRSALLRLVGGACTPCTPASAQPSVAAGALWWTAVRQPPELPQQPLQQQQQQQQPQGGDMAGGKASATPVGRGKKGAAAQAAAAQAARGASPATPGAASGGGPGQGGGPVVLTQRVHVVGPMDADSLVAAALQGRLPPGAELCGTVAGLHGPPPPHLFRPLDQLLAAAAGGGGRRGYQLVQGW